MSRLQKKIFQYIYIIEYDLLHDIEMMGKSSLTMLSNLSRMGIIVDTLFDIEGMGTLDDDPVNSIVVKLIYRTVVEPDLIEIAVEAGSEKIVCVFDPHSKREKTDDLNAMAAKSEKL
jgi:hypothetical protein